MSKGEPLRLELRRRWKKADYIIGELSADGVLLCNTLELPDRGNAPRVSCIPAGEYKVILNYSPAFKRVLPLLLDVPGRSGIRIHRGNWPKDSTGCILPGENRQKGAVLNSARYEDEIIRRMRDASGTTIKIY